jgi:TusA-related sulfurtransferase
MGAVTVKRNADHTLDFRGTISTISLLKVTQVFHAMKPKETMEILGCDEDTRKDLFRVLPEASYDLLYSETTADDTRAGLVRLRKRR